MHIAIIAHSLYPIAEPFAGGLEMITCSICNHLVERGHRVDLYAHPHSISKANLIGFPLLEELDDLDMASSNLGVTAEAYYQSYIYHNCLQLIANKNYDIVQNHSLHHLPILYGELVDAAFFTTFHTPAFPELCYAMQLIAKPLKQHFIVVSKKQKTVWQDYIEPVNIHTIYNGIDTDAWKPRLNEAANHPEMIWVGRICPEKGTHYAIEACIKSQMQLNIVGPVSNTDYYQEKVEPYLDNPFIHYDGHLTHRELESKLRNATALLFTSTWDEPYGLVIAEALACATPVIAFPVGASKEILSPECGIITASLSSQSLMDCFSKIKSISRKDCRKRAINFCNSDVMVDEYLKIYDTFSQIPMMVQ